MNIKHENRGIQIKQGQFHVKLHAYHSLTGYIFITIKNKNKFTETIRLDRDEVKALADWLNDQDNLEANK